MSRGVARFSDLFVGICCCHPPIPCIGIGGIVLTHSSNVKVNSRGTARISDIVIGFCGHPGVIVTSRENYISNRKTARCLDLVVGCLIGIIVTCSNNTSTG